MPERDFSWEELEEMTAKKPGLWTWTTKGLISMKRLGFTVVVLCTFDNKQLVEKKEQYLYERGGEAVAKEQIRHSDMEQELEIAEEYLRIFPDDKIVIPTIEDIKEYLNKGFLIVALLDATTLNNEKGNYVGHFVVVYDIDEKNVYFHDPGLPPQKSRKVKIADFIKAWQYPKENQNIMAFKI